MGNAASHSQSSDPNSPSSPSSSQISAVRDRSGSHSSAFPSSPIKAILSHRANHSASHSGGTHDPAGGTGSNSNSRGHTPEELIDGGHFTPQGLYAIKGPAVWDYKHRIVRDCIVEKRLAPFYRGLEDYEEEWTDEEVIEGLREARSAQIRQAENHKAEEAAAAPTAAGAAVAGTTASATLSSSLAATTAVGGRHGKGRESISGPSVAVEEWPVGGVFMPTSGKITEKERKEARAYQEAAECPICFLYYPPNINTTRCCQQPLCTECFVQIKRAEATVTHLGSEPACCPYCMEPDLGVIYEVTRIARPDILASSPMSEDGVMDPRTNGETLRRKSVNAKSKDVVTTDQIRPDWEEKLNAVKAAAARRASRRIIMHQVGDRLIPVGYTSSRSAAAAGPNGESGPITMPINDAAIEAMMSSRGGGRRGRRNTEQAGHVPGANELEELMIMEAMRLSMIEHDEQQRKAEEERKKETEKSKLSRLAFGFRSHHREGSASPSNGESSTSTADASAAPSLPPSRFGGGTSFPDFGVSPTTTSALAEAASTPFIDPLETRTLSTARPQPGDLIDLNSSTNVPQLKDFSRVGSA